MNDGNGKTVLVFQGALGPSNRQELDGIFRCAREQGWRIQTVEYAAAAGSRFNLSNDGQRCPVKALLAFWKPIGCIVECAGQVSDFDVADFGKTPLVFLDRHPSTVSARATCVYSDADSISTCAAQELLSLGFSDYGYVPWIQDTVWSRERGERFAQLVRMNGKNLHLFDAEFHPGRELDYRQALRRWVEGLPRPCGIFAANDCLGEQVLSACQSLGVDVPDQIAVLGVDDDPQICENATPTLSSIQVDCEQAGYLSAALLAERIAGRSCRSCAFGARKLNRRASTHRLLKGGIRLTRALDFIRQYACDGIDVADVVRQMGCSRRMADIYFKESVGHTVHDEIHAVRLERVKDLLGNPRCDLTRIAGVTGYSSNDDLRRVFRKKMGCSMTAYRTRIFASPR